MRPAQAGARALGSLALEPGQVCPLGEGGGKASRVLAHVIQGDVVQVGEVVFAAPYSGAVMQVDHYVILRSDAADIVICTTP